MVLDRKFKIKETPKLTGLASSNSFQVRLSKPKEKVAIMWLKIMIFNHKKTLPSLKKVLLICLASKIE